MNRKDFQKLSEKRLNEATCLLNHKYFSGAYYLYGYVIECALKTCIAKQTRRYDFPDKNRTNEIYTHNLERLIVAAGLKTELDAEKLKDSQFKLNWNMVKDWSEASRYEIKSVAQARDLSKAVTDPSNGVLQWVKRHW